MRKGFGKARRTLRKQIYRVRSHFRFRERFAVFQRSSASPMVRSSRCSGACRTSRGRRRPSWSAIRFATTPPSTSPSSACESQKYGNGIPKKCVLGCVNSRPEERGITQLRTQRQSFQFETTANIASLYIFLGAIVPRDAHLRLPGRREEGAQGGGRRAEALP